MSTLPDKHFRWDGTGPLFIGDLAPGQRAVIDVRLSEIIEQKEERMCYEHPNDNPLPPRECPLALWLALVAMVLVAIYLWLRL